MTKKTRKRERLSEHTFEHAKWGCEWRQKCQELAIRADDATAAAVLLLNGTVYIHVIP